VRRQDHLYLIVFGAMVGQDHDPALGQIAFSYLDSTGGGVPVLTPTQKENAKRDRAYWLLVLSEEELSIDSFLAKVPLEPIPTNGSARLSGDRLLPITNLTAAGNLLNGLQIYASDPKLVVGAYPLLNRDFIEISEVCQVLRLQNYTERGYTWGRNGEEPLTADLNILPTAAMVRPEITEADIQSRLLELFEGRPGKGASYSRTVQNLTAGLVAGNPGRAGESAASPNQSVCLPNGDRVTYTNQESLQTTAVQVLMAINDGNGNAIVTAQLNTNAPAGSHFSEQATDHKIYAANGTEQSSLGQFINLGGTGSLIWIGTQNSSIAPGQECYFQPAIVYPAGSGFSIPFEQAEYVWLDGVPLDALNIRRGQDQDLDGYIAPQNGNYIAVLGQERSALHYIYKHTSVTSDASGVLRIPATERGCFAYVNGVLNRGDASDPHRIDRPIITGVAPNTTYQAWVYYPPRNTESWQVQFKYCAYQGLGDLEFLEGAAIASKPYCFLNTQGSGNSVFRSDSAVQFSPISMHLPSTSDGIQSYEIDAAVRLANELRLGAEAFREFDLLPGSGLAFPRPGMKLSIAPLTGLGTGRSLNAVLKSEGQTIGFKTPILYRRAMFQIIVAFLAVKGDEKRLVIATHNGIGGENVSLNASMNTAFDTFRI
jgi:hypothetical protein